MKIHVTKNELENALKKTLSVVSTRALMPILGNLLVEASDKSNNLIITASDMDITVCCTIPAVIEEPGIFTIPAKIFDKLISNLPHQEITISSSDNIQINITNGRGRWKLTGIEWTDFPLESDFNKTWGFDINAGVLKKALNKVFYSRGVEDNRRVLNGILLSIRDKVISFAATDSRRLALVEMPLESEESVPDGDILLPPKTVNEILHVFDDEENINVAISDNRVYLKSGNNFISKMIEGTYPNFRQVIPKHFNNEITIPREEFKSILNRVAVVVAGTSNAIDLRLKNDDLEIYAFSQDTEASEPISVIYQGEPITISFNPTFLMDPLKYLECENITIKFNDEFSPIALTGDEGFIYIIMPMHR